MERSARRRNTKTKQKKAAASKGSQPDGDSMNDENGMGASSPIGSKLQSQLKQVAKLIITHKDEAEK